VRRKVAQGSSELNENVRAVSREGRLASHDLSEVEAVRRSASLHSRAGRERRPKAATLSHYPTHRKVTFAVSPTLIHDNKTNTNISDSGDGCNPSEKSKRSQNSQSSRSEKEKLDLQEERLLLKENQESSLSWVEVEDSGRGSCSDESQVLSLDSATSLSLESTSSSLRKLSRGEEEDSAYSYAYSKPNSNQTQPTSSSNIHHRSSRQPEEVGNIYEEIRPVKKTLSSSYQISKDKSGEEDGQTSDNHLVLNISCRKSHRQQFYRFTDWDLAADLQDPVEAFQPVPQINALVSQQRERGTQTETQRVNCDLGQKNGEKEEVVKGALVKARGGELDGEKGRSCGSDLGRKLTLSKSFSRLLSFRKVKK